MIDCLVNDAKRAEEFDLSAELVDILITEIDTLKSFTQGTKNYDLY